MTQEGLQIGLRRTVAEMLLIVVGAVLLLPLGVSAGNVKPLVPCTDSRGCPDLLVESSRLTQWHVEQRTFTSTDCAVVEGETQTGERFLLRFTSNTPNQGAGDLIIGNPSDHPEWFDFETCHGHPHFKEYADYRLWTLQGYAVWTELRKSNPKSLASDLLRKHSDVAAQMVAGRKQGFCVIDVSPATLSGLFTGGPATYTDCLTNQGISVGWADEYHFTLDGQWIDVTDIPAGSYILEDEVNAERFFEETNYANNASAVLIQVPDRPGRK